MFRYRATIRRVARSKGDQLPHVGDAIRKRRMQLSMRPEDLASRSGQSLSTISRIERGGHPTLRTLERIASALDTTPAALLSEVAAA